MQNRLWKGKLYVSFASRCRGGLTSEKKGGRHIILLAASASISWVFAKSILNASLLGGEYGIVGACAYSKANVFHAAQRFEAASFYSESTLLMFLLQLHTTLHLRLWGLSYISYERDKGTEASQKPSMSAMVVWPPWRLAWLCCSACIKKYGLTPLLWLGFMVMR